MKDTTEKRAEDWSQRGGGWIKRGGPVMGELEHEVMAALFRRRFGEGAIDAWKRAFQNSGWDDVAEGVDEWHRQATRGDHFLNSVGVKR